MALHINGIKASAHGVAMGDEFISELSRPAPAKGYVTNKTRLEDGTRSAIAYQPYRMEERSVTLVFNIHADTTTAYKTNKEWLFEQLKALPVIITEGERLPGQTFRLVYADATSYGELPSGKNGKLSVKFTEYNPNNR